MEIAAMSLIAPVPVLRTAVTCIFTVIFFLSCHLMIISGSLKSCRPNPTLRLQLLQSPAASASPGPDWFEGYCFLFHNPTFQYFLNPLLLERAAKAGTHALQS